ncbi:MAG: hypothetical protein U0W24_22935 [Bacteroidales bacterium]
MTKFLSSLFLAILLGFCIPFAVAQKFQVTTKSVEDIDSKLIINYDIIKGKPTQKFKVTLVIKGSSGGIISTKSVTGDIGENVTGGNNKQIKWDYNADKIILNDSINIEVFATLLPNRISTSKALLLSSVCPGLGILKIDKGKPYWLMGVGFYGSIGASVLLNKKASDNYNVYLNNTVDELNADLLSTSQNQDQLSKIFAYTAVGIWGINMIWTAVKAKKANQSTISMLQKQKLFFSANYDPFFKTNGFIIKYKF